MIDANYFEVLEEIDRVMSKLDKIKWIINGKPVSVSEKDKQNCPCCGYPNCDHDHSGLGESSGNTSIPDSAGQYESSLKEMKSIIIYYHNNEPKLNDTVNLLKNVTGRSVVPIFGGTQRVETLYYS